jgi:glutathione synthase/RimK-type ligase-like ATP-grasp enzyme
LRNLVDKLGLVYAAIDMRRTPDGRYVFLEVNPSGQWLFIENLTGQRMSAALAAALAGADRHPA